MKRTKSTFLVLLAILLSPMVANADLITLHATSIDSIIADNFSVVFDDTGDGLLQWDEIVSFSGFYSPMYAMTMDILAQVPDTAFSTFTFDPSDGATAGSTWWGFQSTAEGLHMWINFDSPLWDYSFTPVPEPSTLALLGIGLFGMGLTRRKRIG